MFIIILLGTFVHCITLFFFQTVISDDLMSLMSQCDYGRQIFIQTAFYKVSTRTVFDNYNLFNLNINFFSGKNNNYLHS